MVCKAFCFFLLMAGKIHQLDIRARFSYLVECLVLLCPKVFSDEVMVKSCSDFSRFSSGVDSTPGNVEVAVIGVDDVDGSIGINLILSIALGLKG